MSEFQHIEERARTVPIAGAGGTVTIESGNTSKRKIVYSLYVKATAITNLTFNSGATAISGAIPFAAAGDLYLESGGAPVLTGRELGEALTITNSGAIQIDGFAVIGEVEHE